MFASGPNFEVYRIFNYRKIRHVDLFRKTYDIIAAAVGFAVGHSSVAIPIFLSMVLQYFRLSPSAFYKWLGYIYI